jgi:hypothetical protein
MADTLQFVQVGDLAKGITENVLPHSAELAGQSMRLNFEDGSATHIQFNDARLLAWEVVHGMEKGRRGKACYKATCPRPGIYLVDLVQKELRATSLSLVLDISTRMASAIIGTLPTRSEILIDAFSRVLADQELTAVSVQFLRAAIDAPFEGSSHLHTHTDELIGKRIQYVYSQTEAYEHIYLNSKLYCWQCLKGIEKGLADTDRCHYYKIADKLYLFVWREKVVPTLGVVLIDLQRMKTTGKLFGYEGEDFGALVNAPIGAYATLLNITSYDLE